MGCQWLGAGGQLEDAAGELQHLPHHEPTIKKPRQGSGAREIREIRKIQGNEAIVEAEGLKQWR
jgi:hypothetical protein